MKKKKLHWSIRAVLFVILLCLTLSLISGPFIYPYTEEAYNGSRAIYEERPGALDAVFIGTSNTLMFWVPLFAWEKNGIATCNYTMNGGKLECFRYLIEEARKTQPDALYVISLGSPTVDVPINWVHWATDYMKPSLTKLRLFKAFFKYNSYSLSEKAEVLFPLFFYHSRWEELSSGDFSREVFAKGAAMNTEFLVHATDITGSVRTVSDKLEPDQDVKEALLDLLEYLDQNRVRALFLNPPQFGFSDEMMAKNNTLLDLIETKGYPVLRTREMLDGFNFDFSGDYYNYGHTNIHGAAKYTGFLSDYLQDQYAFQNKHGDPDYTDFDEAWKEYAQVVTPLVLDFEINGSPRDYSLISPEVRITEAADGTVVFSWDMVPGAEGYLIYRQKTLSETTTTPWERIDILDGEERRYVDVRVENGNEYYYAVIPYRHNQENGQPAQCYGKISNFRVYVEAAESP